MNPLINNNKEKGFLEKLFSEVKKDLLKWVIIGVLTFVLKTILEMGIPMSFITSFIIVSILRMLGVKSDSIDEIEKD